MHILVANILRLDLYPSTRQLLLLRPAKYLLSLTPGSNSKNSNAGAFEGKRDRRNAE
jgi:hypothetical protein